MLTVTDRLKQPHTKSSNSCHHADATLWEQNSTLRRGERTSSLFCLASRLSPSAPLVTPPQSATMEASSQTIWPQLLIVATVAATHMSMPNHWLPYSLVARAHSWSVRKALLLTALGAAGHVAATIAISLLISEIGAAFISHQQYRVLSSALLFVWGLYYLYSYSANRRNLCCESSEKLPTLSKPQSMSKSDSAAVQRTAAISLVMLTTLSPCVGSMPVLVTLMAPPVAPSTVLLAAAVLFITSMSVCCALVAVSLLGASTMEFTAVRKHERLILAAGLILLAALTFFVFADDHEHHHHQPLHQSHTHEHRAHHHT